jgi:hypothetical protein
MEKFQLIPFIEIKGIGAASGIVYQNNSLFIISDNSTFLYHYDLNEKQLDKIKLFDHSQESLTKKDKADFESLTLFNEKLYLYGSGSTKKRNTRVAFNLQSKETKEKNLTKLYNRLIEKIAIAPDELNIEGVIMTAETIYFFQRGNGLNSQNGIFCYDKKSKVAEFQFISLPKINEIEATFTDAILVDTIIYFLAAAENTTSTYNDGEIEGSIIGRIDLKTMQVKSHIQISNHQKFEGLTLYKKTATQIELLLCEDNDTEELTSIIYKLIVDKV